MEKIAELLCTRESDLLSEKICRSTFPPPLWPSKAPRPPRTDTTEQEELRLHVCSPRSHALDRAIAKYAALRHLASSQPCMRSISALASFQAKKNRKKDSSTIRIHRNRNGSLSSQLPPRIHNKRAQHEPRINASAVLPGRASGASWPLAVGRKRIRKKRRPFPCRASKSGCMTHARMHTHPASRPESSPRSPSKSKTSRRVQPRMSTRGSACPVLRCP